MRKILLSIAAVVMVTFSVSGQDAKDMYNTKKNYAPQCTIELPTQEELSKYSTAELDDYSTNLDRAIRETEAKIRSNRTWKTVTIVGGLFVMWPAIIIGPASTPVKKYNKYLDALNYQRKIVSRIS
ncbi:hypothetical protein KMW28_27105 [Flammeovirga yaeyamensis]|uniref:Uncharacterized protein n=1 Tax=Flammeovirga yaeyamensis TaxID=367791 RepID=A0AAX1NAH6_9BACT|nr:hypothetical protein [Flammeovirga yaeyamensis]MBB3700052.1 hypothetical protein [Flammeovirga yaeyamensis]NMF37512.1 hypothetical protein [Flammeovirga yaeyamensis]QWG04569.1 hypothetical protein KMW28_27105 [Flammeovirga yaeyamensis]